MLLPYVGDLDVRKVHDDTLRPLVDARLAGGVSPITIKRTLEVVRAILNRAARAYRDADGFPWLETAPPLITMLPESPRLPHPIAWEEQDRIFDASPTISAEWRCLRSYGPARQQLVWLAMVVGGADSRAKAKRVRSARPRIQVAPRARRHFERCRVVDYRDATRQASGMGVPLSRQACERDEQHRVAARAARRRTARRSRARLTTHVCDAPSCSRCRCRRSSGAPRPLAAHDARTLRECRHRTACRTRRSRARSRRHEDSSARRKRLTFDPKQAMRDPKLWIKGRAKVAQAGRGSGFAVLSL